MGDLEEMSFIEIWHGEKFQELRQKHLSGDISGTVCDGCRFYL